MVSICVSIVSSVAWEIETNYEERRGKKYFWERLFNYKTSKNIEKM